MISTAALHAEMEEGNLAELKGAAGQSADRCLKQPDCRYRVTLQQRNTATQQRLGSGQSTDFTSKKPSQSKSPGIERQP